MRVLHCIPTLDGGGAERQLAYLCSGLVDLGVTVDVAALTDGVNGERLRGGGARLHELGWRRPFDPRLPWELARLISERRIDVVQTWQRRMDVAGGLAALMTRRPWVYSERTVWREGGARQWLRQALVRRADAVIANSENAAARWRTAVGAARVEVVANALPLDEIAATAPAPVDGWGEGAERILFVGRFMEAKGIDVLGEALARVLEARPRATALACGEGALLDGFRSLLARRGVAARCRTPGFRSDVWALARRADVLLAPSRWEGSPNAVAEAMACGCPLVLSDIPGHRELAGDLALYFTVTSATEAAAAVARALDDREGAVERARRARARIEDRSIAAMARRHLAIYAKLQRQRR